MLVTKAQIAAAIPHTDAMVLLDGITAWDDTRIDCVSQSHLHRDNPLRIAGRLPAVCGIEYAAQAMAVHGALSGRVSGKPLAGFLASVRDLRCHAEWLDTTGQLTVEAERLAAEGLSVMYGFVVRVGGEPVVDGRATVLLALS